MIRPESLLNTACRDSSVATNELEADPGGGGASSPLGDRAHEMRLDAGHEVIARAHPRWRRDGVSTVTTMRQWGMSLIWYVYGSLGAPNQRGALYVFVFFVSMPTVSRSTETRVSAYSPPGLMNLMSEYIDRASP